MVNAIDKSASTNEYIDDVSVCILYVWYMRLIRQHRTSRRNWCTRLYGERGEVRGGERGRGEGERGDGRGGGREEGRGSRVEMERGDGRGKIGEGIWKREKWRGESGDGRGERRK